MHKNIKDYDLKNSLFCINLIKKNYDYLQEHDYIYDSSFAKINYLQSIYRHSEKGYELLEDEKSYYLNVLESNREASVIGTFFIDKKTGYTELYDTYSLCDLKTEEFISNITIDDIKKILEKEANNAYEL